VDGIDFASAAVVSKVETTEFSTNSPESKMFFKCLLMADLFTPNISVIAFCVIQKFSRANVTPTVTFPSGVW
jgi:hypothetical protein